MDNLKHGYLNSANIIPSASNRLCTNQPTRNQEEMKKSCLQTVSKLLYLLANIIQFRKLPLLLS